LRGEPETVVEVAVDLEQPGTVYERLGELAERDLPLRYQHGTGQSGPGGVRGGGRARVTRTRADDRLVALLHGAGHGDGHPPVLERTGRVGTLDLEVDVASRAG